MAEKKTNKSYLSGREIRAIAKANQKEIKRLEAYKNRKASESEFLTEMRDPNNILEIEDLHTYFYTEQGVVKAVNGVSYDVPKHAVVGVVGESGCGKSVTSMSVMRLIQGPTGQIAEGSIRFHAKDYKRDAKGNPVASADGSFQVEETDSFQMAEQDSFQEEERVNFQEQEQHQTQVMMARVQWTLQSMRQSHLVS